MNTTDPELPEDHEEPRHTSGDAADGAEASSTADSGAAPPPKASPGPQPAAATAPEKKKKRKMIWLILLLIPVVGAMGAYQFFVEERAPRINPMHLIPSNAMFVLETDKPYQVWKQLSRTNIWKSLQKDKEWAALGKQLSDLDKSLSEYESIIDLLGSRTVYVSGHPYRRSDHDYMLVVDTDGIPAFQKWLTALGTTTKRTFQDATIFEIGRASCRERV